MHNYKALKAASKASVRKQKVIDRAKVDEVKDGDGVVTTRAVSELSHEVLQVVCKCYDSSTGEAKDDYVQPYTFSEVKDRIDSCKTRVVSTQSEQAEWEQIETDLKAL